MALDQLKEHLSEMDRHAQAYVEDSLEYVELKGFKYSMVLISFIVKSLIIGLLVLLALFFLSLFFAYYLSEQIGDGNYGFLILGAFYVVGGAVFYFLRHKLNKPLLRIFSNHYFDKR